MPFPAADLYERLVPYRSNRSRLKVATHQDYEMAVLRLLAGERGFVQLDPTDVRDGMQREVTATNPDPGFFRNFPDARVMVNRFAAERVLRGGPAAYAPPEPEPATPDDEDAEEEEPRQLDVREPDPPGRALHDPDPRGAGADVRARRCGRRNRRGRPVLLLRRLPAVEPQGQLLSPLRAAALGGAQVPGVRQRSGRGLGVLHRVRSSDGLRVKRYRIAVIAGDGIGPEVIEAAIPVLERAAAGGLGLDWERLPYSADHYLATGETLPDAAFAHLRDDVDAIFLGAIGDPRVPGNEHARDILLGLRFRLDLYINFRPVQLLHPDLTPLRADRRIGGWADGGVVNSTIRQSANPPIDFVIFRENTEGVYLGRGRISGDEYIAEEVNTAKGVDRIIRAAFEWAKAHGKTRVTMSDKSNAIPAHRIWQERFKAVAAEYPGIQAEHRFVDALAMEMVREPERFQVIVTNNLYGDILSDLGAGLVGGLGLAASANLHPGRAGLFEPVHGSAPPLKGKGVANPMAAILTGALMFEQLGHPDAARALERAVRGALAAGARTPDVGGSTSTRAAAEAVTRHLEGKTIP